MKLSLNNEEMVNVTEQRRNGQTMKLSLNNEEMDKQ
jgi:hypothetical protein